ncbi:MAG: cation:proton antiporter [Candidatus Nanoarchaeia archaeon]
MLEVNYILEVFVLVLIILFISAMALKRFKQPYVLAYILVGLLLGSSVFGVIKDQELVSAAGSIGVMMLLFFVGMEMDLKKLLSGWKIAVIGTIFQIMISILVVWIFGNIFGWSLSQVVLLGFVISLSSTAVVLKILEEWKETNTHAGRNVVSILLAQDFAVIPMIIILGMLGGGEINYKELTLQIIGMIVIFAILVYIVRKKQISFKVIERLSKDHELQVFLALILCFGLALIAGFFYLSVAIGAFVAGLMVSALKETEWIHDSLNPFRIVFVAIFFISIGLLIDLSFLLENLLSVLILVGVVLFINTFINAGVIYFLKNTWKDSLYAGAMLSQVGEFSFLLVAIGFGKGILGIYEYQLTIQVIALSLLLSPVWIMINKKLISHTKHFRRGRIDYKKTKIDS